MNNTVRACAIFFAAVVLNACAAIPVSTDYDPGWQMPASASYAWMPHPANKVDPMIDNDLVAGRVQRAVDDQLAAKGLSLAKSEADANLLVTYHIGEEDKLDINSFHSNFGYYPCWRCWGPGFDSDVWVTQYTQGKLIIDLVDAKTKQLVWRGIASRRVPSFDSPQERDKYIRESVAAIFKKFPPS
ncbi:MAG TPA: DUF4136 domain-containing protein [Spongiibacteraceae bacterium]|jgi:hypothetical protein